MQPTNDKIAEELKFLADWTTIVNAYCAESTVKFSIIDGVTSKNYVARHRLFFLHFLAQ